MASRGTPSVAASVGTQPPPTSTTTAVSGGARGVLGVLQPPYSYATHGAPPKSYLQFSTMNQEEEGENEKEEEEKKERWKKEEEEDEPSLNSNYRFVTAYKIVKQLCK